MQDGDGALDLAQLHQAARGENAGAVIAGLAAHGLCEHPQRPFPVRIGDEVEAELSQ